MLRLALVAMFMVGLTACDKASEEDCRKAVVNIQKVTGTENASASEMEQAIRACRARSTKEGLHCMQTAKTPEDLLKCEGPEAKTAQEILKEREAKQEEQKQDEE